MNKDLSLAIRNLRIPLALLIVIGHSDILHFPLISQGEPVEISSITAMFLFALRVSFAFFGALLLNRLISHSSILVKMLAGGRI